MSANVFRNTTGPARSDESQISHLSAAYPDSSAANAVVDDLERAGLRPTVIVPLGSWTVSSIPDPGGGLFEHPVRTAATGAVILGLLTTAGSLIWLDGRQLLVYAGLGLFVGALSGWVGSALAATAHPAREEDLLAHPGTGVTIEVEAEEAQEARLAEVVMGQHGPTLFQARTRPGPRGPAERVMWEHEAGLSPLEALGSWLDETGPGRVPARGRHLQENRLRP